MNKELIMPIVRHALQVIGGVCVAKGIMDESTSGQIVDLTITAIGAVMSVITMVWMVKAKQQKANQ